MELKQQAEALFFGSGVQELYGHWQSQFPEGGSLFRRHGDWESGEAPNLWAYQIRVTDPMDTERLLNKVITYSVLYTAAEMINDGKADDDKPFHPVSAETGRVCGLWVYSDDLDGFDPHTLDEVLQVAVYGGLRHPHFETREHG